MTTPLLPGARLGVVGGGQLGRMFTWAAQRMGYRVTVLTPDPDSPAGLVADEVLPGALDDPEALERLARDVDAVTFEFENVDVDALGGAESRCPLRPGRHLLEVARDRRLEKATFARLGLPLPALAVIECEGDLRGARERVNTDAVLKTALSGYDGKGQRRVRPSDDLAAAWSDLGRVPCVLEAHVSFEAEISVVGARGLDGELALYEPVWNAHADHVLDVSVVPAPVSPKVAAEARRIAASLLEELDVVGVLCTELFLLPDDRLVVNEMAPRPHNSGHLTIEGHACSQFEQQVRALCGLPLGSCDRVAPAAAMANLLGDLWSGGEPDWSAAHGIPGARVHLYGKREPRAKRKMGHITATGATPAEAEERVRRARELLVAGRTAAAGTSR